ncbi:hypothetical protein [Leptospira kirschneri]|uniref:hypothetical protein n=1 Tax=Leptospira kirschneri TaxID=29507 RepID=UPI000289EEAE|nr:hypothetical protein [Leptospira kirschneri]EMK03531.1 hypothetical protein LEP1GSC176_3257 [Leptospira kirschneri str. MMD1493]EMK13382.1 hypothetical protein LEP1GSC042_3645 [Leptospira kirschneri serovar Bim str. PUO 1247]EMN03324.1 hypothetical protein LEP1GSC046_3260 [Leptospira kirschneri serovar Bim str. 1051]WBF93593.1 hypothetical protein LIX31_11225 [Leptospira kirschneri]
MKLTIGSIHLDSNSDTKVFLSEKDNSSPIRIWELSDFLNSIRFYECRFVITEVVVGFVSLSNINFLEYLPSVQSLWILTSNIKDFSALSLITNLKKLRIDRVSAGLGDVLLHLQNLEEIFLDHWVQGAENIFELKKLKNVSLRGCVFENLKGMMNWKDLKHLWLHGGKINSLTGIPTNIESLRLTRIPNIRSLDGLSLCSSLLDLRVDSCKKIISLNGIENCIALNILSMIGLKLESLEPVRHLKRLEYVVFAGGTRISNRVDVLYNLPMLKELIVPRHAHLDLSQFPEGCNVRVVN